MNGSRGRSTAGGLRTRVIAQPRPGKQHRFATQKRAEAHRNHMLRQSSHANQGDGDSLRERHGSRLVQSGMGKERGGEIGFLGLQHVTALPQCEIGDDDRMRHTKLRATPSMAGSAIHCMQPVP